MESSDGNNLLNESLNMEDELLLKSNISASKYVGKLTSEPQLGEIFAPPSIGSTVLLMDNDKSCTRNSTAKVIGFYTIIGETKALLLAKRCKSLQKSHFDDSFRKIDFIKGLIKYLPVDFNSIPDNFWHDKAAKGCIHAKELDPDFLYK